MLCNVMKLHHVNHSVLAKDLHADVSLSCSLNLFKFFFFESFPQYLTYPLEKSPTSFCSGWVAICKINLSTYLWLKISKNRTWKSLRSFLSFQRNERVNPLPGPLKYISIKRKLKMLLRPSLMLNFKGCHSQVTLCSRDCFQHFDVI